MELQKIIKEQQERNREWYKKLPKTWKRHSNKSSTEFVSISMSQLDCLSQQTAEAVLSAVREIIKERQKGWLGTEEDGSDRHPHYDELDDLLTQLQTNQD